MVSRLPEEWGKAVHLADWIEYFYNMRNYQKGGKLLSKLKRLLQQLMGTKVIIKPIYMRMFKRTDWEIKVPKFDFSTSFISLSSAVLGLYSYKKRKTDAFWVQYLNHFLKLRRKYEEKWEKELNLL